MDTQNQPKQLQKTKDAIAMVMAGIEPRQALMYANLKNKVSDKQVSVLRQKVKKHSLLAPQMVKLAHAAIKDCLQDKPIVSKSQKINKDGEVIDIIEETAPTWTNKIAASAMIYDRYEPVARESHVQLAVVHPISVSAYQNPQQNQAFESQNKYLEISDAKEDV